MTQAQVPTVAKDYFGSWGIDTSDHRYHPVITQVYREDVGWRSYPIRKRVSRSWIRRHLVPEGVTRVQLSAGDRHPDFSVKELLR